MAAKAENMKRSKYNNLVSTHFFAPVAIETSGCFGPETASFIQDLGRKLRLESRDANSYTYLAQRLSVAIQRGNAASVLGTMSIQVEVEDDPFH